MGWKISTAEVAERPGKVEGATNNSISIDFSGLQEFTASPESSAVLAG
jgi:hypothetical protein